MSEILLALYHCKCPDHGEYLCNTKVAVQAWALWHSTTFPGCEKGEIVDNENDRILGGVKGVKF